MTSNKVLLSAVIIAAVTAGCRTDVLKKNRIAGEWNVTDYTYQGTNMITEPGVDITMTMEYDKDGDFEIDAVQSYGGYTYSFNFTGTWEDDDKDLQLDFDPNSQGAQYLEASLGNAILYNYYQYRETYDIIELTKDKLEMETTINGQLIIVKAEKES